MSLEKLLSLKNIIKVGTIALSTFYSSGCTFEDRNPKNITIIFSNNKGNKDAGSEKIPTDGSNIKDANNIIDSGAQNVNDEDAGINPGLDAGLDAGNSNNDGGIVLNRYFKDKDSDGYGNPFDFIDSIEKPFGYVENSADCDDNNSSIYFYSLIYADQDNDRFGAGNPILLCIGNNNNNNLPNGYSFYSDDCDDSNSLIWKNVSLFLDNDNDGFGNQTLVNLCIGNNLPNGYSFYSDDCDDNNSNIHSYLFEYCDGLDNDCNPTTSDDYNDYPPLNSKENGVCSNTRQKCISGAWQDNFDDVPYYEQEELSCDTLDNDCDGSIDEVEGCANSCVDSDGGRNYYVKGTTIGIRSNSQGGIFQGSDFCNGDFINDLICYNTNFPSTIYPVSVVYGIDNCSQEDKICIDGICAQECFCSETNDCSDTLFYTGTNERDSFGSPSYSSQIELTPSHNMLVNSIKYYVKKCNGECYFNTEIYNSNGDKIAEEHSTFINNEEIVDIDVIRDLSQQVKLESNQTYRINQNVSSSAYVNIYKTGSLSPNTRANGTYSIDYAIDSNGTDQTNDLGAIAFKFSGSCN